MNKQEKQELIEWISKFSVTTHTALGRVASINTVVLINKIQQLDEPQKVKAPQFVADWFEEHKHNLSNSLWKFTVELNEKTLVTGAIYTEFESWFIAQPRVYEFITRMGKGYEVQKEQQWVVMQGGSEVWHLQGFRNSLDGDIVKQWCSYEGCIKFTDRKKAEAVATLVDGSVEEV